MVIGTCNLYLIAVIWREYIGYDIDLDLPSVIMSPHMVSTGNDYSALTDGNLQTCVELDQMTCHGLKVNLFIGIHDKRKLEVFSSFTKAFW